MKAKKKRTGISVAPAVKVNSESERKVRLLIALACIAFSALATVPFFFMGRAPADSAELGLQMPVTHDMHLHFEQMKSFYNGLAGGEIYPRWEEDTNRGYGAPTTSYYPPAVYYVTSAFYALTKDWMRALLNAHLLMMIASAAALYLYARQMMARGAAVVAMAAYIFLPYHILDQYQRGAMAEMLGFIWMPLMFLFGERLFKNSPEAVDDEKAKTGASVSASSRKVDSRTRLSLNLAGLAATYGAFLWSHPPTAYQFTLAFAIYALVFAYLRRNWGGLLRIGAAMAAGLALSAAYMLPAFLEQDLIRKEYIAENWPYHATYVFLHDLPYSDVHRGFFNLIDAVWVFSTVALLAGAVALLLFKPKALSNESGLKERILPWVVVGCFASFMMLKASAPIGRLLPQIEIGVFTWRMLSITTLVGALLIGTCVQAAINASRQRRRAELIALVSVASLILLAGVALSIMSVVGPMYRSPIFVPSLEHVNVATIPRTAPEFIEDLPEIGDSSPAHLGRGNGRISIERWDPEHRAMRVESSDRDQLFIRTFNFPGWTAKVNGEQASISTGPELGDIVLTLEPGIHYVTLDYLSTPVRRAGNFITVCSFFSLLILALGPTLLARRKLSATNQAAVGELSYEKD